MPKLSIITVNLNNAVGLEKTIKSVINQTYKDFEFIIIDGGSTDGSSDLIKNYEKEINYWISEKDDGIYAAMNEGIKQANGEYCLFLNSGDYLFDKYVFTNVFLLNPCKDIVYGNMIIDSGDTQQMGLSPERITLNHLLKDTLWHPVSFIKRQLFDKVGYYDTSYLISGDYDFFLKAFIKYNCSQQHINIVISVFNLQGISSKHDFADLVRNERNLTQINNLDSKVIDLYNELNNQIQDLKQASILLQSSYNKLLNSKTYKLVNLLKKNLLNPIFSVFKK